jgi:tetratricopeptide (TPR) repeat protein
MLPVRPERPPPSIERKPLLIACVVLVVVTFAVFARIGAQDFINFDDPDYVTVNAVVRDGVTAHGIGWAFTHFHSSNWHPLTWISHMIDVQLFGMNAGAHKLVNVAFHAAAAVLLLLFLFRATGELWPSALVAALFALHPTRVESVAWVSERKDVLSAFFWMLTLYLYAGYVRDERKTKLIGITIAFACALMSKPSAITLPFVLLLLDWWPFARFSRKAIIEKIPLFALLIPSILLTLRAQTAAMGAVSFGGRIANTILSYVDYLRILVWPSGLAILYPYRLSIETIAVVLAALVLLILTAAAIYFARRAPWVLVGWLWFLGTLVPMSGLVQVGRQSMADRYTYIAFVGLFIAIVWSFVGAAALSGTATAEGSGRHKVLRGAVLVILIACCAVTYVQAGYWENSETVFARAVSVTKRNDIAHLNYGAALLDRGAVQEALAQFRESVAIDPASPLAQSNLGRALAATGDPAGAEKAFAEAIKLAPTFSEPYRGLASLKMQSGKRDEALALLQKANASRPDAATRGDLAVVRDDVDTALTEYASAVRDTPNSADIRNSYAAMLARKGRDAQALDEYREALRIEPGHYEANMNIGALLSRSGRDGDALGHFEKAADSRRNTPEPHIYLALIYGNRGEPARAVAEVEAAARIDQVEANRIFTNAVRIPFRETNLADYRAALLGQRRPQ